MASEECSELIAFLRRHEIPHRVGTLADGADLVGEPILDLAGIEQLLQRIQQRPDLENNSEAIYRLCLWARALQRRIQSLE